MIVSNSYINLFFHTNKYINTCLVAIESVIHPYRSLLYSDNERRRSVNTLKRKPDG